MDLDAIEQRTRAATEGPWKTHDTSLDTGGHTATVLTCREALTETRLVAWLPTFSHEPWNDNANAWANAEFIAHARTDVPALVARVRELEEALASVRQLADVWAEAGDDDAIPYRERVLKEAARKIHEITGEEP